MSGPSCPLAFDDVFETALAKSPDERYSTCGELVEAAGAALRRKKYVRRQRGRTPTTSWLLAASRYGGGRRNDRQRY